MGGNCVELAFGTARLLLDLGLPLRATGPESLTLPDVPGLATGGVPEFLGVVLSHSHLDHCGLVARIHPGTPLFLGAGAQQVLAAAADFTGHGIAVGRAATYCDRVPFEVGPFRITPYLNDHSAYDAYSLLVEAGGSRLFYTGDLRGHGRTGHRFERLLANGPRGVDAVLLEGTTVGRDEARARTEAMLEDDVLGSIRETDGLVLTCFSGQNVDRIVSFYKAARRAGRILVLDAYTAHILGSLPEASLPKAHWAGIGVYLSRKWRAQIKRRQRFDLVEPFRPLRVFPEDLAKRPGRYVLQCRPSMLADLDGSAGLAGAQLIYSLWSGYLDDPKDQTTPWCARNGIPIVHRHTSGHADVHDLRRLVAALQPRRVVPIHTAAADRYKDHFDRVHVAEDGAWWSVA